MRPAAMALLALPLLGTSACSETEPLEPIVCVAPDDPATADGLDEPVSLEAGAPLRVAVYSECLAAEASGSCELVLDSPGRLRLTSSFSFDDEIQHPCFRHRVTCETDEPLPAGNYELTYGADVVELTIPGEVEGACVIGDVETILP